MRWLREPSPAAVADALRVAAPDLAGLPLAVEPAVPCLPEVVAAGTSPLILVTRRVRGMSLFKVVDGIGPDHAARQLARFLAVLHSDQVRRRAEAVIGPVPAWYPLATTEALRERLGPLVTQQGSPGHDIPADASLRSCVLLSTSTGSTCTAARGRWAGGRRAVDLAIWHRPSARTGGGHHRRATEQVETTGR